MSVFIPHYFSALVLNNILIWVFIFNTSSGNDNTQATGGDLNSETGKRKDSEIVC